MLFSLDVLPIIMALQYVGDIAEELLCCPF